MAEAGQYEIHAIRYGHFERRSGENFLGGDVHDVLMPLDYFVWAIVGKDKTFIVDTGFDTVTGDRRGRSTVRPVEEGLASIGIDHAKVSDVIISHMHYDHCGNHHLFPNAMFHLQDAEMDFATGRCMCHHAMRHPFEAEDVANMVRRVYSGKVCFHDAESQIASGITLHKVGGHSRGLQVVRVETASGAVVIASDATHFYANMDLEKPFPVFDRLSDVILGVEKMRKLASSQAHIVPGHDPLVLKKFTLSRGDVHDIVRLDKRLGLPTTWERLLALHRASRLSVLKLGSVYTLESDTVERGAIIDIGQDKRTFTAFIDATGQQAVSAWDVPFPSLIRQGAVREARAEKASSTLAAEEDTAMVATGGIDLDNQFRPCFEKQLSHNLYCVSIPFLLHKLPFVQGITGAAELGDVVATAILSEVRGTSMALGALTVDGTMQITGESNGWRQTTSVFGYAR